jgi:DNA-binding response OmpR family regulator
MSAASDTVLLVEDNINDVILIQRAFARANLNCAVQVARDGEEGVSYLLGEGVYGDRQRYPLPVLVLLDVRLPRLSGLEFLVWLREQSGLQRLPVVMLTASTMTPDVDRAHDLGANCYLVKPVALDKLTEMVRGLGLWMLLGERPRIVEE